MAEEDDYDPFATPQAVDLEYDPFAKEPGAPPPTSQQDERDLVVDRRGGGPFKLQVGVAAQPDEREQQLYLEKTLGEYGKLWRRDAQGRYVVRKDADPTKGEVLLFPEGFEPLSMAARAAGEAPRVAAAVTGGVLGAGGGPVGAIAGATALETGVETARRQFMRDELGPSFARESVPVAAESLFANTLGEVLGGLGNRALSPMGRGSLSPERQMLRGATDRLIGRTELTVPTRRGGTRPATPEDLLNVGELTGSRSLERLIAMVEKHPGSTLYRDKIASETAMVRLRQQVEGEPVDASVTGENATGILRRQFEEDVRVLDAADRVTEDLVGTRIAAAGQGQRLGPVYFTPVFARDAAQLSRVGYAARREAFRQIENDLGGRVANAPGGQDRIVSTEPVVRMAEELYGRGIRSAPRDVPSGLVDASGRPLNRQQEGEPIRAFIPSEVKADLLALSNAEEKTTIEAMRRFRQHLYNAMENPEQLAGFGQGDLKQLARAATEALHEAERTAAASGNSQLADAMFALRTHHSENIDQFNERGIVTLAKRAVDPGEQPPAALFVNPAKTGDVEVLRRFRSFFGEDSVEWSANVSSVWNELLIEARDPLTGRVDARALASSMQNLQKNGSADILFGPAQSREINQSLNALAAQQRYIEPRHLQGSSDPLITRIATARTVERQTTAAYRNSIIEPFLEGRIGPETFTLKSQSDQFTRFIATRGTEAEVNAVIWRLERAGPAGEEALREIRSQIVQDVLRGGGKVELHELEAATGREILQGLPISAARLRRAMDSAYGETPVQSNRRLQQILGRDVYENLRDMLTVEVGRRERASSAPGTFVAGFWFSSFIQSARGMSDAGKYAVVSRMLSMPGAKKWLGGKFARQPTRAGHGSAIFAGQLAKHILKGLTGQDRVIASRALGLSEPTGPQPVNLEEAPQ